MKMKEKKSNKELDPETLSMQTIITNSHESSNEKPELSATEILAAGKIKRKEQNQEED